MIALAIILFSIGLRVLFPPFYTIGKKSPVQQFTYEELFDTFVKHPVEAPGRYAMQPLLVEGRITGIDGHMILMSHGMKIVRIKLMQNWRYDIPDFGYGDYVLVKGICRGMDLTEVVLTHAIIITVRK